MKKVFVVLNYNDFSRTSKFIEDVKNYESIDEIVVVDNNSTDGSYRKLKKINLNKLTVLKADSNKGYGAGNNIGCIYANEKYKNPIIFISNPDIIVEEEAIKTISRILEENDDIALATGNILQDNTIERGWKLLSPKQGAILNLPFVYKNKKKKLDSNYFYANSYYNNDYSVVDVVTGCFFAIKGNIMKDINYFDENIFLYNEEEVLAKKLKEKNYKSVICNNIDIVHEHSVSISKTFSSVRKVKISNKSKIYYQKNYNNATKGEIILWYIINFISLVKECIKVIINKIFN